MITLFVLTFITISLFINKDKPPKKEDTIYRKISMFTLWVIIKIFRIKVNVNGWDKIPEGKFLLVSNHLSMFDPIIYLKTFSKNYLALVSKKEIFKLPFVGRYMAAIGCIPMDRENNKNAVKSISKAQDMLLKSKYNIGIYPEGGINMTDEPLRPLRNGAFKIAKKADVPIVIAVISGSNNIKSTGFLRRKNVNIDIAGVISREEVAEKSTVQIGDKVRLCMTECIVKRREELQAAECK